MYGVPSSLAVALLGYGPSFGVAPVAHSAGQVRSFNPGVLRVLWFSSGTSLMVDRIPKENTRESLGTCIPPHYLTETLMKPSASPF